MIFWIERPEKEQPKGLDCGDLEGPGGQNNEVRGIQLY